MRADLGGRKRARDRKRVRVDAAQQRPDARDDGVGRFPQERRLLFPVDGRERVAHGVCVPALAERAERAVEVAIDDVHLSGTLDRVGERGALRVRPGAASGKHLVRAWVDHVAWSAALVPDERPRPTCAVGTKDSTAHFEPLDADRARGYLGGLLRGYRAAQAGALPAFANASQAYVEALSPTARAAFAERIVTREAAAFEPHEGGLKKARTKFDGEWEPFPDAGDPYVALATRGRDDPFEPADHFARWALCLWAPLLTHKRAGVPS